MTFFVEKKLALGRIRFSVAPHDSGDADNTSTLSTGPGGEFIRRHSEGYFFGEEPRFDRPLLPDSDSFASAPFWTALKGEGTVASYALLGLLPLGAILFLLGLGVVASKGAPGWIEVILGLAMMSVPVVITAQRRKRIRAVEARRRSEIDAADRRNREMLGSYMTAFDNFLNNRENSSVAAIERERGALELPYETWAPVARRRILQVGFDELATAKRPPAEIGRLIDRASAAAGLSREDAVGIKQDLYQTVLWHFIADRRLDDAQTKVLEELEEGFRLPEMPLDRSSADQFRRIRAAAGDPQRRECSMQLGFQEYCVFEAGDDNARVHVTNKRLLLEGSDKAEIALPKIYEMSVNVDEGTTTVKSTDRKKPVVLQASEPVFTAAVIDLAAGLDQRPKAWA